MVELRCFVAHFGGAGCGSEWLDLDLDDGVVVRD